MNKVIDFKAKASKINAKKVDPELKEMLDFSDDLDAVVLKYLNQNMCPKKIAVIMAKRLGGLINMQIEAIDLLDHCTQVMEREVVPPMPSGGKSA